MSTARGLATRTRIVEAAAAEVREQGANAVTLEDVCRRSGTGRGQLFHHFPGGREQIMLAAAELEAALVFDDQEPYLSQLTSAAAWREWSALMITRYRDQGVNCPLAVLVADIGRYSPAAQDVAAQLVRRWQECLREGIVATQANGEARPDINAEQVAAAFIAAIQGGVIVLISTGSAEHLEAGLALCLDHLLVPAHV